MQSWGASILCRVGGQVYYAELGGKYIMQSWGASILCRVGGQVYYAELGGKYTNTRTTSNKYLCQSKDKYFFM